MGHGQVCGCAFDVPETAARKFSNDCSPLLRRAFSCLAQFVQQRITGSAVGQDFKARILKPFSQPGVTGCENTARPDKSQQFAG